MNEYFLGCPVWACQQWQGNLFTDAAPRTGWLRQYSGVFNTVEGNSTFYGLPELAVIKNWCQQTCEGFRFALKFPREVTHEHQLAAGWDTLDHFINILEILAQHGRLGPSLLQLPPFFDSSGLPRLTEFIRRWPAKFPIAVEVRHLDFFDDGTVEDELNSMLSEHSADRALFDSRPLFSAPPSDVIEEESQRRKPRSPHRTTAIGRYPMLRLVGRNDVASARAWIDEWASTTAEWICEGRQPFVFTHAPDDRFAPEMAEMFHAAMQRSIKDLADLPVWPGRQQMRQLGLF